MKKFGLGLTILVVILVGAILIVPSFLNWNEYKGQIEKTASDYTGRTVKIKGDISLSLLPTSALSVKDVSVTNIEGGQAEFMVTLKSLDVKVSFPSVISSLFGGKIKVEKFILIDPVIALEILDDDRVNWNINGRNSTGEASSADISLDKFQIVNGQISFEDMAHHRMELIRKINANVKVKSINGPFGVEGSAKYKGLEAGISFNLGKNRPGKKVPVSLDLDMLDGRLKTSAIGGIILSGKDSFFAGKLAVKANDMGDMVNVVDRFKGQKISSALAIGQAFSLDAIIEAGNDNLSVSDINVNMGPSRGQGNMDISFGENIDLSASLSVNKLDLDELITAYEKYEKQPISQTISLANNDQASTAQSGSDNILNHLAGKLDLKLGALKYNAKIASQINVKISAKDGVVDISTLQARMPGGSALNFTGKLSQDTPQENVQTDNIQTGQMTLDGDLSLTASNLRGLLNWVKVDVAQVPSGQLAQFSYESGLKLTSDMVQLYGIDSKLDAMSLKGGLSYALQERPSFGITLDLQNFNLDSYMQDEGGLAGKKDKPNEDLNEFLAILDDFDASYKIALSNVTIKDMRIKKGQLEGLLLGGKLENKIFKLDNMAGINLNASGKGMNFSSKPELMVEFSANAKSLAPLQRALKTGDKFDLRRLGQVKAEGVFSASLAKVELDIKSKIGVNKIAVKGVVRSATLKQLPHIGSIDIEVAATSLSLAAVIDQLNLPLTKPRAKDDRPVAIKGHIKQSSDLLDIDGKINIAASEVAIKGRQKGTGKGSSLDFSFDLRGRDTREFIRGIGVDFQPSSAELGPIMLKAKVIGSNNHYSLNNMVGNVGPVKLSGSGKVNLAAAKPYFDFNMKTGEIPLQDFLRKKTGKAKTKSYGQWSKDHMDLSLMSAYEGRAQISAASLRYNDYVFANPTFETVLKNGILSVNNFTGQLFGGTVDLSAILDGQGEPKMDVEISLRQASLSQATKSSAGIAPITGLFDLSGKFTSSGKSQFDMISALNGQGNITASAGVINGIDIPALSRKLTDMNDNRTFLNLLGTALSGGQTSYKGGVSDIVAKAGKISFSPFDIEMDGATSNVKMDISLIGWNILSRGSLSLTDHPNAPPIEVDITGDIDQPRVVYNTDRLKKYVGSKIAANMLQNLIGNESGGLEGIFGQKPSQNIPKEIDPARNLIVPKDKSKLPIATSPEEKPVDVKPFEAFGQRLLQKLLKKENPKEEEPKS